MTNKHSKRHIHYISHGTGQPVILIHGMAASLHDWDSMISGLAANGYQAFALDLPGHGDSLKPEQVQQYHVERLYRYLLEWIEELDLKDPPLFIGHSLGGYLSLLYARRNPQQVRGLALIDPLYSTRQLSPLVRLLRRRPDLGVRAMGMAPEWMIQAALNLDPNHQARFSPETRRQIVADYKRAHPNILYITRALPDLTAELPQVDRPALVVWGEKDQTLRPDSFQMLAEALPNAGRFPVSGSGHQPHRGQPELVNSRVVEFLSEVCRSENM
jgi:pimeloyl-ACP methyl ester carboxylesterase